MTTAALASLAIPALERFGRWVLPRLIRWGLDGVIDWTSKRIDVLSDRRKRLAARKAGAKAPARARRLRWLAWRVRWRRNLIAWLKKHRAKLEARLLRRVERTYKRQIDRIPWDRVGERFESWRDGLRA